MVIYKAMPQPNMSFNFANNGDPGSTTITLDLEADGDKNLIDYIMIDKE